MSDKFESRDLSDYFIRDLPFNGQNSGSGDVDITAIRILDQGLKKTSFDIGSIAFKKRRSAKISKDGKESYSRVDVVSSSLCNKRTLALRQFLENIYLANQIGRFEESSLCNTIYQFMRYALWCDRNSNDFFIDNIDSARKSLQAFSEDLLVRVRTGDISDSNASNRMSGAISGLEFLFDLETDDITTGISFISSRTRKPTQPPGEEKVGKALSFYSCLFLGISEFALQSKKFPSQLHLPDESVWMFPTGRWCATSKMLKNRASWGYKNPHIDYANGKYLSLQEIRALYPDCTYDSYDLKQRTQALEKSNIDLNDFHRKRIASTGCKAFMMMFIANTGMNLTSVASLKWDDSKKFDKSIHGFRTIKKRSDGKEVEFMITNKFQGQFNKYLRLRSYLLDHCEFEYLFAHLGHGGVPGKITSHTIKTFKETCNNLSGGELGHITAREWRAHKADYAQTHHDVATTAMLLQNSVETVLKSYSEGSYSVSGDQLTNYFDDFNVSIVSKRIKLHVVPGGKCKQPGQPSSKPHKHVPTPDCESAEGCLFCDKYAVHADLDSVRRLLSMRYVITETEALAASAEHFIEIFGPTLLRIDQIVNAIRSKSSVTSKIVDKVLLEIDQEKLDPYWEAKLTMLFEIGAIE